MRFTKTAPISVESAAKAVSEEVRSPEFRQRLSQLGLVVFRMAEKSFGTPESPEP